RGEDSAGTDLRRAAGARTDRERQGRGSRALNDDRGAITQHLSRRPLAADLRTLVPDSDDGIRAEVSRVLQEQVVRLATRLLAHFRVRPDLSADNLFQSAKESLPDRRGSHNDAADDALVFGDPISLNGE